MALIATAHFTAENYQLFKDLLDTLLVVVALLAAIVTAVLGAFAYAAYRYMRSKVEKGAEEAVSIALDRERPRSYSRLGYAYWLIYEEERRPEYRDVAINLTRRALTYPLDESRRTDERLLCNIRNNLAYYLAERGLPEDKDMALECVSYIRQRMTKYPDRRDEWTDTYDFVLQKYGQLRQ